MFHYLVLKSMVRSRASVEFQKYYETIFETKITKREIQSIEPYMFVTTIDQMNYNILWEIQT